MTTTQNNPFLEYAKTKTFNLREDAFPFDKIKVEHYLPAVDEGIRLAKLNIEKIKSDSAEPNFENTMLAMETASEVLDQVTSCYFGMFSAEGSPELQALAPEISKKLAEFQSDISLDEKLFERIKKLHDKKPGGLNPEQAKLLEKTFKGFTRNGALLSAEKKEILRKIDQELASLSPQFSENVLKATNAFELWIDNKEELKGLPDSAIEAAAHDAEKKGKPGKYLFTLQAPSFLPVVQYADNRELRKKIWFAYSSRAFKDQFDNQENILKIIKLNYERANLLGFKNYAEFALAERMAQNSETVWNFLKRVEGVSKRAAEKDVNELKAFRKTLEGTDEIEPWDFAYYSEKLKEKKYQFNEEELRPYFKLENVLAGVFEHAKKLYHLDFKEINDVPVYHPDVKVFEVRDSKNGNFVGLFYTDFFPRETKKGGAWMGTFRDQGYFAGKVRRPLVMIVCNFTKPTPSKPSLLTYDEVLTLFHEFGHALHGLLSNVTYRTLAGTNVYWDFVELPSQIMENWVKEKESLDIFAKHYETGKLIPAELVEKLKRAQNFQAGHFSLRQVQFATLDMNWFTADPATIKDVDSFEDKAINHLRLIHKIPGTNTSCAFGHIFGGGYAAGYYSYKWAEVLDADAFEFFKEKGLFNSDVSQKFKDYILSPGGTEHPMELYKKFRGREPDPDALFRREGLLNQ